MKKSNHKKIFENEHFAILKIEASGVEIGDEYIFTNLGDQLIIFRSVNNKKLNFVLHYTRKLYCFESVKEEIEMLVNSILKGSYIETVEKDIRYILVK